MRLFLKSWVNDFPWVKQAMISVNKTCYDPVEWHICIDDGTRSEFEKVIGQVSQESPMNRSNTVHIHETSEKWPEAMTIKQGYLRQQWIKMNSYRVMGDDLFWIWDSDLIAQRPFSSQDFMDKGGKPIYWITQFNSMMGGSDDAAHNARRQMLRDIYGIPDVAFEWMRCIPIPQVGGILKHASSTSYWAKAFKMLVDGDNRFSEFNVIGQFCHLYFPDAFDWRNTHNFPGKTFSGPMGDKNFIVSQAWSWGGVTQQAVDFVKTL